MWRTANLPDDEARAARAARWVTLAATALFVLLLTRWQPWELFARAGYTSDFYDEQADAFWRGRLWVDPDVAGIEGFLIDGRTYLYYGPFLALVRLPTALLGDLLDGRLVRLSMTIGFVVYCTGLHQLLVEARRWWGTAPSSWRSATMVAAGACSPMLALAGWVSVYHETELWAATFAVWAAIGALRLAHAPSLRAALLAGGATAAALLTRASVGIGVAAGVGAVVLVGLFRRRCPTRQALVALGGGVAGLVGHMAVNAGRFGSLLGLPADRQVLTLQDPERAAWFAANGGSFFGLGFIPSTVIHYLRPDSIRVERLVPFVRFGPPATDRSSIGFETITPASSLTASATVLAAAATVGLVILVRRRAGTWLLLTAGAILGTIPTLAIGFIGNRYLVDLLPVLVVPAAAGIALTPRPTSRLARRALTTAVVAGLVAGAWVNAALSTWISDLKEPSFTALRYRLDGVLFTGPPPGLQFHADGPVGRDGTVAVVTDTVDGADACVAVYIAEQGRWVALERASGPRHQSGSLAPQVATRSVVATGDGWQILVEPVGQALVATLDHGDGLLAGEPVPWFGDEVDIEVVVDPTVPVLLVAIDGETALVGFEPPSGRARPGPDLVVTSDPEDSLCRQLVARR